MPGKLRCDRVDFRNPATLRKLHRTLKLLAANPASWASLQLKDKYHFTIASSRVPSDPGWYVICDKAHRPLYVGKAEDLASRLNSDDGSRDGFANPKRASDPARNFIKSFHFTGAILKLEVLLIPEPLVLAGIGISGPLSDLDRGNIEKVIGLFRARIV